MFVNHAARRIFLCNPRTASRATAEALKRVGFFNVQSHARLFSEWGPVTPDNRHEWDVACTVRNHWDTMVSWIFWDHAGRKKPTPQPWDVAELERVLKLTKNYVTGGTMFMHLESANFVMRYETLERDLRTWCGAQLEDRVGVSAGRDGRHYTHFLGTEERIYIGRRFSAEISSMCKGRASQPCERENASSSATDGTTTQPHTS